MPEALAQPGREPGRDTTRLEGFSDAVFAIMLTLLGVELLQLYLAQVRQVGLGPALLQKWHSHVAFGLTFLVVGQIWMTHHNLWRYITRIDQGLSILNLVLLMVVAAIPFAAKVLADSFADLPADEQSLAATLYSATMLGQALAFNAVLWWARRHRNVSASMSDALFRAVAVRFLAGPLLYSVALVAGLFAPLAGMACYLAVVLLYLWPGAGDLPD